MAEEKDPENGYLEDVYVTDIGLPWVASQWNLVDMFNREPDRHTRPEDEPVAKWLGAARGLFDPAEYGISARAWLQRTEEAWLARVRRDDPAFAPPSPQPVVDEELRRAVLQVIHPSAEHLGHAAENPPFGTPVTGLAPALR
ncbi:hypothetical protein [Streptomyces sp. NPDC001165]|uniref:hypothetical protein n=1 Tax=Streptomyces sp. NPDC001165 TaxID=3364546 RepID=UPI0036CB5D3C